MAASPPRRTPPHRKPPRSRGWTPAMDAVLTAVLANGRSYDAVRLELRRMGEARSYDTVRERARELGLRSTCTGITEEPTDIRAPDGADRLLVALAANHLAPPVDVVPSARDARPLAWRRLVPAVSGCGSPGALCADLGGTKMGW